MSYQKILTLLAMIGFFGQLSANSINVYDISICPGETREFYIYMNTTRDNLVAFQIDLKLPDGLKVNVDSCALPSRILDKDQKLYVGLLNEPNNVYRFVSTSFNLTPFTKADAPLVKVSITASDDFKGGVVSLQDMFTVKSDGYAVLWISAEFNVSVHPYIEGDVDRDGTVNIIDCMSIVNYLLEKEGLYSSLYDINGDNRVDVADVQQVAVKILRDN